MSQENVPSGLLKVLKNISFFNFIILGVGRGEGGMGMQENVSIMAFRYRQKLPSFGITAWQHSASLALSCRDPERWKFLPVPYTHDRYLKGIYFIFLQGLIVLVIKVNLIILMTEVNLMILMTVMNQMILVTVMNQILLLTERNIAVLQRNRFMN